MRGPAPQRITADPNVVPMLDVLLVLLIIFMLMLQVTRLDITLPAPAAAAAAREEPLRLTVEAGPRYLVDGVEVATGDLASALARTLRGRGDSVVVVEGDAGVRYQDVLRAFDVATGAGASLTTIPVATR